jgi:undecaprenyl-diphosphatase
MPVYQAIALGLVQGVTEFAPVSSSGHLILVPWLFHWAIVNHPDLNKTFDVALHMGTFLGAAAYFWRDIITYIGAWLRSIGHRSIKSVDERLAWFIVIGTIPGALAGALFEEPIERDLGEPWLIALMLALFGVLLFVVDRRARASREMANLKIVDV